MAITISWPYPFNESIQKNLEGCGLDPWYDLIIIRAWDISAAPGAQWQNLEPKFCWLLQHGNMCARRERVVYPSLRPTERFLCACLRPTEAARFRAHKCANNHQLIVAGIQRIIQHAYALCTVCSPFPCHTYTQNAACAKCIYENTNWRIFCTRKR